MMVFKISCQEIEVLTIQEATASSLNWINEVQYFNLTWSNTDSIDLSLTNGNKRISIEEENALAIKSLLHMLI